jgi:hypothetical protein
MRFFFKYLFTSVKYLLVQGIIEIIVITILEYLGFNALSLVDFSISNLFTDNIQSISWLIAIKTLLFGLAYLVLFVVACYVLHKKQSLNRFIFSILNSAVNASLWLILFLLEHVSGRDMMSAMFAILLASGVIVIYNKPGSLRFKV